MLTQSYSVMSVVSINTPRPMSTPIALKAHGNIGVPRKKFIKLGTAMDSYILVTASDNHTNTQHVPDFNPALNQVIRHHIGAPIEFKIRHVAVIKTWVQI